MQAEAHATVRPLQVGGALHALCEGELAVAGPVLKSWAGQCAGHWHSPHSAGAAAHVHHGSRAAAHAHGHAPAEGQERVRLQSSCDLSIYMVSADSSDAAGPSRCCWVQIMLYTC